MLRKYLITIITVLMLPVADFTAKAQAVSGVWQGVLVQGKGLRQKRIPLEMKLVKNGDTLVGTAYYFSNARHYIRYAVKGHFEPQYNTVVWQDIALLENTMPPRENLGWFSEGLKGRADFSCPDGKTPVLSGTAILPGEDEMGLKMAKGDKPLFSDEWDEIIDEYYTGGNRPELIESVWVASLTKADERKKQADIAKNARNDKQSGSDEKIPLAGQSNTSTAKQSTDSGTTDIAVKKAAPSPTTVATPQKETGSPQADLAKTNEGKKQTPPPSTIPKSPVEDSGKKSPAGSTKPPTTNTAAQPNASSVAKTGTNAKPASSSSNTGSIGANNTAGKQGAKPQKTATAEVAVTKPTAAGGSKNVPDANPTDLVLTGVTIRKEAVVKDSGKLELLKPQASTAAPVATAPPVAPASTGITDAYAKRKKELQTEMTVSGDSLELRFYDNAEVDGDSITLFLDGRMLFQHVRLEAKPYVFKISVSDLGAISELTMVAENLGAIPPNTAFMEAFAGGVRHTARLVSTEQSSGVIRLVKKE